jgi:hypothetical protein
MTSPPKNWPTARPEDFEPLIGVDADGRELCRVHRLRRDAVLRLAVAWPGGTNGRRLVTWPDDAAIYVSTDADDEEIVRGYYEGIGIKGMHDARAEMRAAALAALLRAPKGNRN